MKARISLVITLTSMLLLCAIFLYNGSSIVYSKSKSTEELKVTDAQKITEQKELRKANLPVLSGLDVLIKDDYSVLKDRNIGLITNHTAIDRSGTHILNYFQKKNRPFAIKAIFTPEHGLEGKRDEYIDDKIDKRLVVPIYSLYGENRKPTREMVTDIDTFVFDIQDIGSRYYTYITTMAYCMEAAAYFNIPFVVLDRPNPLNGVSVSGAIPYEEDPRSFTSVYPIPTRHGMTAGELALLFNDHYNIKCNLYVVKMENWDRKMFGDETKIPWRNPSPNIRNIDAAILYSGLGALESMNLSVGRGTSHPFFAYGAPFMDKEKVTEKVKALNLPGVSFKPFRFKPNSSTYANQWCEGFYVTLTDKNAFNAQLVSVALIKTLYEMYPKDLQLDRCKSMVGDYSFPETIRNNTSVESILELWNLRLQQFESIRSKYLLY